MKIFYKSKMKSLLLGCGLLFSGAIFAQVTQLGTGMVSPQAVTNDGVVVLSTTNANYI